MDLCVLPTIQLTTISMKIISSLSLLLVLLCAFQCETYPNVEPATDLVSVTYGETQCSDSWQKGATDAETLKNIEAFLSGKNIRFTGTAIAPAPPETGYCQACTCPSGRVIKGTVRKDDLAKIQELKFATGS